MAILNKIRQRSLFLIIIIAMALFSFVLADLFKNNTGFSNKSQNVIATINGEDIKRDEFMNKVESAQRQFGGSLTNTQAMNRIWDQEVKKAVMETQYDALGLNVERDQMRDLLKLGLSSFEEFKNEAGVFDEDKLNEFIANLKEISPETALLGGTPINYEAWTNYENNIAVSGKEQVYFNMIKAGVIGTLAEAEVDYKLENDKADIKYVQVPYSSIPDSTITVSKAEISNYIKKHKDQYEVEASRGLYFVHFKEEASLEDETNIQDNLKALLDDKVEYNESSKTNETITGFKNTTDNEGFLAVNSAIKLYDDFVFKNALPSVAADSIFNLNKGDVYGPYKDGNTYKITKMIDIKQIPDSVKVRHILIPFAGALSSDASVTKTEAEAKKTADSILSVLKRNRSKFTSLLDLSYDKVSNQQGGEIEFAYNSGMAPEFKNFSFANKKGTLGVVKTDFGYHIIEILSQGAKQKAVKVGHLAQAIEPSEKTIDETFNKTSKFEIAVASKDFNAVAKENNYSVLPVSNVRALDESIPGLGNQRAIVRWAFEEDTKIGDVKRFNLQNGGYAVVMLTSKTKKGLMSTENASVTAIPEIRKEKKAAIIKANISGTTLEEIAASQNQSVQTALAINMKNPTLSGAGREPKVIGTAFGLKEGQISKPIKGNNGVYVIQVTKITPADGLSNYQSIANRIGSTKATAVNTELYNALKKAANIEDNRATFY
jgi:peptidyl-prolyl cis-trans isomerase D